MANDAAQSHGFALSRQGHAVVVVDGEAFERFSLLTQVCEVSKGELGKSFAILRVRLPEHDEAFGSRERQRPQEHGVDDREDGRVGADAQRERHNCHQRESRLLHKHSRGVANVLPESFHCLSLILSTEDVEPYADYRMSERLVTSFPDMPGTVGTKLQRPHPGGM